MKRKTPMPPLRYVKANQRKTEERIQQYQAKLALLQMWEQQPVTVQIKNRDYLMKLRARVRASKMYILHRNDPRAVV
jgi:hypothetical protein